ncbi:MAG: RrF2 family transcriptional regulator [Patescibacteria group bacterium]
MRVSTRGEYGVRAMLDLALQYDEGATPLRAVAGRQGISEAYLEQLMGILRKAGLVASVRGAQGGYRLSRPPGEIRVGDIMRAVEGPIGPTSCVNGEGGSGCCQAKGCVTRLLWERLRDSMVAVLDHTTLGDLCAQARAMTPGEPEYYI